MSISKTIKKLSLSDLASLASSLIIECIEKLEFEVLCVDDHNNIEIQIQENRVRLFFSEFHQRFTSTGIFEDLSETDCIRCFVNIEKDSKAYKVLIVVLGENKSQEKRKRLDYYRKETYKIEKELDLSL
jgi:hypothetical protein